MHTLVHTEVAPHDFVLPYLTLHYNALRSIEFACTFRFTCTYSFTPAFTCAFHLQYKLRYITSNAVVALTAWCHAALCCIMLHHIASHHIHDRHTHLHTYVHAHKPACIHTYVHACIQYVRKGRTDGPTDRGRIVRHICMQWV